MPGPTNTLLIEGTFEELADELAHYIDEIRKKQSDDAPGIQAEITPLLEQGQKNEALKKIVTGSAVLNAAPEKGETVPEIRALEHEYKKWLANPPSLQNSSLHTTFSYTSSDNRQISINSSRKYAKTSLHPLVLLLPTVQV